MIHTLTFNPGIDLSLEFDELRLGEVQRPRSSAEHAGGKGMNVALALSRLEVPAKAWVFLGGSMGEKWKSLAERTGVEVEGIEIAGETRQNIKIFESSPGRQTDLNAEGPAFDEGAFDRLLSGLAREVGVADFVVAAGSSLPNTPIEAWLRLGKIVRGNEGRLVMDTTGPVLDRVDTVRPWMVKLNLDEYNGWRKTQYADLAEIASGQARHVEGPHLVLTQGSEGALGLSCEGGCERISALPVEVRGTVGAGDAFTAGFLAAWLEREGGWRNALAWGAATAAGAVELPGTSFPTRERVLEILTRSDRDEAD